MTRPVPQTLLGAWAISPEGWELVAGVWSRGELFQDVVAKARERWKASESATEDDIPGRALLRVLDGVGVISVRGPLFRHAGLLSDISGAASYDAIWQALEASISDVNVKAILFRVNSPGGEVDGVGELADFIYASRGRKPIWTYYEAGASAAVWLGSQADKCVAYRGAEVGCIGVMAEGTDTSAAEQKDGRIRKQWVSTATPAKRSIPIDDDVEARIRARLDAQCDLFVADLARGRGVTPDQVIEKFGAGDLLIGAKAQEAGLVDELADFDSTLAALRKAASTPAARPARAAATSASQALGASKGKLMSNRMRAGDAEPDKKDEKDGASNMIECEHCKGDGTMPDGSKCETCGGTGKVAEAKKAEHDEPDGDEAKAASALAARLGLTAGASPRDMLRAFDAKFVSRDAIAQLEAQIGDLRKSEAARAEREIQAIAGRFADEAVASNRQTAEKRDVVIEAYVEAEKKKSGTGEAAAERLLFPAGTFGRAGAIRELSRGGAPLSSGARPARGEDPAPKGHARTTTHGSTGMLADVPVRGAGLHAAALALMEKNPKLTYDEAQNKAFAEDPTLY